ncbi:MAG: arsenite methyltransferase [Acidobacteriaceae bacterium]
MSFERAIKETYSKAAVRALVGDRACCCGSNAITGIAQAGRASHEIYGEGDTAGIPAAAIAASLGCGNPAALARLKQGETVLDLGSGGGIDVFVSARRVGSGGKVYGLDMTDEMLILARENQRQAGIKNVEFLKGRIESIPLPDSSVDVVISNCVLNLSTDKSRVLREAFRVLKPGGRFAVSDVVLCGEIPSLIRDNPQLWAGCLAGAMQEEEYKTDLIAAGFVGPSIEPTRIFRAGDVREFLSAAGTDVIAFADELDGKVMSASVCAIKPAAVGATSTKGHIMPKIQILGTGCARCQQLTANTEKAVQGLGLQAEIEKVTEIKEILKFQILMTPGLAINGKVKSAGRVPAPEEIREMLLEEGGN